MKKVRVTKGQRRKNRSAYKKKREHGNGSKKG